jgi:hypothetical protein
MQLVSLTIIQATLKMVDDWPNKSWTVALSLEPIQEPLKVLLAQRNIGQLSSLQLDVLFEAQRISHPLYFTELMKQLTFNLICDLMNQLATEIPLVFNSKWQEVSSCGLQPLSWIPFDHWNCLGFWQSLSKNLVTIIYVSTYTASIADSAKDEEARSEFKKMPVVSESWRVLFGFFFLFLSLMEPMNLTPRVNVCPPSQTRAGWG